MSPALAGGFFTTEPPGSLIESSNKYLLNLLIRITRVTHIPLTCVVLFGLEFVSSQFVNFVVSRSTKAIVFTRPLAGFPGGSEGKASACGAGDQGLIPGLGRSPGEGNGSPLQYSCLENPMDREAWWAIVHEVAESDTTE